TGHTLLFSNAYTISSPSDIDLYSFKTDYEQNFKKGRLGLGGKISYVTSANDYLQYDSLGAVNVMDTSSSNNFNYKENINAVYANYNRALKGWTFQAGLRLENTNIQGVS